MRIFVPKRKVGKRLFTHQCFDLGTSVATAKMYSGDGGLSADGDQITGGGDTSFIIDRAKDKHTQNEIWMTQSCIHDLEEKANRCGDWQKYAPTITHLQEYQRSLRDQLTGK